MHLFINKKIIKLLMIKIGGDKAKYITQKAHLIVFTALFILTNGFVYILQLSNYIICDLN